MVPTVNISYRRIISLSANRVRRGEGEDFLISLQGLGFRLLSGCPNSWQGAEGIKVTASALGDISCSLSMQCYSKAAEGKAWRGRGWAKGCFGKKGSMHFSNPRRK